MKKLILPRAPHHTAAIVSSQRGRRSLYVFLLAVVALLIGLGSVVWPRVTIHLIPKLELVRVPVPVKIDLDLAEPVFSSGIVPGQLVLQAAAGTPPNLTSSYVAQVPGGRLIVERSLVDQLVDSALAQAAGAERVPRPGSKTLTWAAPTHGASGRSYTWPLVAQAYFYRQFPLTSWQQHLAGLPVPQARDWLRAQVGVGLVRIDFLPHFFANLSQKIPKNPSNLSFSLDTN